jgi:hypothetical protein
MEGMGIGALRAMSPGIKAEKIARVFVTQKNFQNAPPLQPKNGRPPPTLLYLET